MVIFQYPGFNKIYYLDSFIDEFNNATLHEEKRYSKWLLRQLKILQDKGKDALLLDAFELLNYRNCDIYAIRSPHSTLNPRVLFFYFNGDNIILTNAFKEKKSSDYNKYIKKAASAYKEFFSDGGNSNE